MRRNSQYHSDSLFWYTRGIDEIQKAINDTLDYEYESAKPMKIKLLRDSMLNQFYKYKPLRPSNLAFRSLDKNFVALVDEHSDVLVIFDATTRIVEDYFIFKNYCFVDLQTFKDNIFVIDSSQNRLLEIRSEFDFLENAKIVTYNIPNNIKLDGNTRFCIWKDKYTLSTIIYNVDNTEVYELKQASKNAFDLHIHNDKIVDANNKSILPSCTYIDETASRMYLVDEATCNIYVRKLNSSKYLFTKYFSIEDHNITNSFNKISRISKISKFHFDDSIVFEKLRHSYGVIGSIVAKNSFLIILDSKNNQIWTLQEKASTIELLPLVGRFSMVSDEAQDFNLLKIEIGDIDIIEVGQEGMLLFGKSNGDEWWVLKPITAHNLTSYIKKTKKKISIPISY